MRRRTFVQASSMVGLAALPAWTRHPLWLGGSPSASMVLKGGAVYDGSGAPPVEVDLAIEGGRISGVGADLPTGGAEVIDVRGMAVAPGFIDIHSHTDRVLLVDPRAESKIRQGVTTEIVGQDGSSIGPWRDSRPKEDPDQITDIVGFFERIERDGTAVNVASMIGAGTVRGIVIGPDDRPATPDELVQMVALVTEAIQQGACGLSSGLEYVPGGFADLDELIALAMPLQGTGLPYASHMRNEDDQLFAAVEETLAVGSRAGVPVHVSHLKAQGQRNWWKAEPVLNMLDAAAVGGDVSFDRYPYVAYSTGLASLFPLWSRDGGTDAFLLRLDDPELSDAIEQAVRGKVGELGNWNSVQITSADGEELDWIRGRKMGELARDRGEDPYVLLLQIMRQGRARIGMVGFGMSEQNTAMILAHPLGMVCSDGSARAIDGPLSAGSPHPRSYGSFPRVLGHYCRDQKLMPLETGIHKMTGMPAQRLRLDDRGRIALGAQADLVVFDPATVADRATFTNPHQYPIGIELVMVNGAVVIRQGEHTGALPGKALRG